MYSARLAGFSRLHRRKKELFKPVAAAAGADASGAWPQVGCICRRTPGGIVGMTVPEARVLLRDLNEHATSANSVYVHKWTLHDLVMWDNRQTMHRVAALRSVAAARHCAARRSAGTAPTVAQQAAE